MNFLFLLFCIMRALFLLGVGRTLLKLKLMPLWLRLKQRKAAAKAAKKDLLKRHDFMLPLFCS